MNYRTIITPLALADNLPNPDWLILDCRGILISDHNSYSAYEESHIPSAYFCSMHQHEDAENVINLCEYTSSESSQVLDCLELWGYNEDTQIILYEEMNSSVTDTIWLKFRSLGFQNVAVLQGGYSAWREKDTVKTIDNSQEIRLSTPLPFTNRIRVGTV